MKIKHLKQQTNYSCGAACFSMITGKTEAESRLMCSTKKRGTYTSDVKKAFESIGYSFSEIKIGECFSSLWWLKNLSFRNPIYAGCVFISNSGRGRNSKNHHAIVFAHGKIFDPSESFEVEFDCYSHTFNRQLWVKEILVIDHELEDYGKARREYL